MRKILPIIVVLAIFAGGCFSTYQYFYGGSWFYGKVSDSAQLTVFNDQGDPLPVTLNEDELPTEGYLKLLVNPAHGVLSWETVSEKEVPKLAVIYLE